MCLMFHRSVFESIRNSDQIVRYSHSNHNQFPHIQHKIEPCLTLNSIHCVITSSTRAVSDSLQSGQVTESMRSRMTGSIPVLEIAIQIKQVSALATYNPITA